MRKLGIAAAVTAALMMNVTTSKPAKADGGAITLAVVAAVLAFSTMKCASAEKAGERLCWMDAFAPRGNITVEPVKRASLKTNSRYAKAKQKNEAIALARLQPAY